jgi:phage terminase large subunit-like protein
MSLLPLAHELLYELCREDRVAFAKLFFEELDPWQKKLLESTEERILIAAARQSGKSTMCSIIALHEVLYTKDSLVLVVSRSLRQSGELTRKIKGFYHQLGEPIEAEAEQQLSLTLTNGSRIVTLPGDEATIRGYSGPSIILADEAARIPDDVWSAVSPMLAVSEGRLIALSTPTGPMNKFAQWWQDYSDFERYLATAYENPRIDEEFLANERRHMTASEYAREYEVSFTANEHALFTAEMLAGAIDDDVEPLPELEELAWRHKENPV